MKTIKDIAASIMIDAVELRVENVLLTAAERRSMPTDSGRAAEWAKNSPVQYQATDTLWLQEIPSNKELRIAGSTAMFLQGHSIVSSGDLTMLAYTVMQENYASISRSTVGSRAMQFVQGKGMRVARLGTPALLKKPSGLKSSAVINAIALAGISGEPSVNLYIHEAARFEQYSGLAALKVYDEEVEVKSKRKHVVPKTENTESLMDLARNTIRLEPVYRKEWLQRYFESEELQTPSEFTPAVLADMLLTQLDRYDLRWDVRQPLREGQLLNIPRKYRRFVMAWQNGVDVLKAMDGNEAEYSLMASYLADFHSLDIQVPPPSEEISDRVELGDLLSPDNFVPVPSNITADNTLFLTRDMDAERQRLEGLYASRFPKQA